MRAFYRVPQAAWPILDEVTEEPADIPDAHLLHESTQYAYLHSATNPNPVLEAAGAEVIAGSWVELFDRLSPATRELIFQAEVERTDPDTGDVAHLRVAVRDIEADDVVVCTYLIPHAWGAQESIAEQEALNAARA